MSFQRPSTVTNADVKDVAEVSAEPCYISEIARKLQQVKPNWERRSETQAVQRVSKAAFVLRNENNNIEMLRVGYGDSGGQKEASPIDSFGAQDPLLTDSWRSYTVIHNTAIDVEDVSPSVRNVVDASVTVEDKVNIIKFISGQGNKTSKFAENILQDHSSVIFDNPDYEESSDYDSPSVDYYVEGFSSNLIEEDVFDGGIAIEISTRWVNPIGISYVTKKINSVLDKEAERGVQIDLLILAPKYTQSVLNRYEDSDIVTLAKLPIEPSGNPIIREDEPEQMDFARGSDIVGPDYPVSEGFFEVFSDDLDDLFRDYDMVPELDYRRQLSTVIGNNI